MKITEWTTKENNKGKQERAKWKGNKKGQEKGRKSEKEK